MQSSKNVWKEASSAQILLAGYFLCDSYETFYCYLSVMMMSLFFFCNSRFANEMVYVGLSYYGPALGNDQYLSFLLSSLVEIPSYLVCWVLMDRLGRRWPLAFCMIVSGISCIITVLLPPGKH